MTCNKHDHLRNKLWSNIIIVEDLQNDSYFDRLKNASSLMDIKAAAPRQEQNNK